MPSDYALYSFTGGAVSLTGQVDGRIALHRHDAQLHFGGALRQSPQPVEEWATVLEIVGNELAVGIETGAVALILNA